MRSERGREGRRREEGAGFGWQEQGRETECRKLEAVDVRDRSWVNQGT